MSSSTRPVDRSRSTGGRRARRALAALTGAALALGTWAPVAAAADASLAAPVLDLGFEGALTDHAVPANPVTVKGHNGSTTTSYGYVPGVAAGTQAVELRGNTYLDLGKATSLQPQDLTLSFWINPTTPMTGEQVVGWNKGVYNSDGWYLSSESATSPLVLSIGPATGQPYKVRVTSAERDAFFPSGTWTHVVVTYDHATKAVAFYRNGVPVPSNVANPYGTDGATGVLGSSATLPKTIGFNGPSYNGSYLKAGLDQYRVYDDVATLSDVVGLYEESGRTIDRAAVAADDAADLALPARATLALVLASKGSRGSDVTWASSDADVIGADGSVHQPAEGEDDANVTLTATARYLGGEPTVRTFDVVVPAKVSTEPLGEAGIENVLLSDDFLENAAAKEQDYLLSLSSEKFLYEFYKVAGLTPTTTTGYGGWERSNAANFRGHAFGHYMSALAMSYQSTRDPGTKAGLEEQIDDAVAGLTKVQDAYSLAHPASAGYVSAFRESALDAVQGTGTTDENVLVPWYNLHKVLAGLLDVHEYVGGEVGDQALDVATQLGLYVDARVSKLPSKSVLLATEYGGMNEALYELFDITGDVRIKDAAEAFDEVSLFKDLAAGKDVLNGKHANTTIPKLIGALKRYTVFTQNPDYYDLLTQTEKDALPMYRAAAENFFDIVVDHHTYVTGANSQSEHFHAADGLYDDATGSGEVGNAETAETCNEYNMLKLSRELFRYSKDVRYADYYENTFINTILASQNPETGTTTYFNAMAPGYHKVFNMPFTEFWCCTGTGMENFSKLGDSIYFTGPGALYVNMFFSSSVDDAAQNLRLTQTADLPNEDTVRFSVDALEGDDVAAGSTVRLRVPSWIAGDPSLTVNGASVTPHVSRGYVVLPVEAGDEVSYTMPMEVRASSTQDNPGFVAFTYGPVVLSADLGDHDATGTTGVGILVRASDLGADAQTIITARGMSADEWKERVTENVVRTDDSATGHVQFVLKNTADAGDLVYTPHYSRWQGRYGIYMNLEEPDSEAAQARILRQKQAERQADLSIDGLTVFDNNNSENGKGLKASSTSSVGTFGSRQFRHATAGGWFSYDLAIDPSFAHNYLGVTYYTGDKGRSFDVYVDDEKLKTVTVTDTAGTNVFYVDATEIPQKYLQIDGSTRYRTDSSGAFVLDEDGARIPVVTVRFQSTGGFVGGVFGVSVDRSTTFDSTPDLAGLTSDVGTLSPAFAPATKRYTLTVPEGTEAVALDADPHTAGAFVRVDGVLVDDTQARRVALADDGTATVELRAFAQDHTTSTAYAVDVVTAAPADPVDLDVTVSSRCVGANAYVAVKAVNADGVPVDVSIVTPYGSKQVVGLADGRSVSQTFNARLRAVPAGTVTVTGKEGDRSTTTESGFAEITCG